MATALMSPWQGFARKTAATGARQIHTARTAAAAQVRECHSIASDSVLMPQKSRPQYAAPEFLESTPSSALRPALRSTPTVSGTVSAGQSIRRITSKHNTDNP